MVQRTVRADLQAFGEALVEILMPKATFDPFKQDNDDVNETAREEKDRYSDTPLAAPDVGAPLQGNSADAGQENGAKSDDDEFTASIRAAAERYEVDLFASQQSFDKLCAKESTAFDDSCMTEEKSDKRGKSLIADLDTHQDTSWDCSTDHSLSFTSAKQFFTDERRQSIMKEDNEETAEKKVSEVFETARQSILNEPMHDAGVTDGISIPIRELAQRGDAGTVKTLVHIAAEDAVMAAGITPQSSNASLARGPLRTPMSTPDFSTPEHVRAMLVTEYNIKLCVQSTIAGGISQNSHETLLKIVEAAITLLRTGDHTIGIIHPRTGEFASFHELERAAPTPELCERFIVDITTNKQNIVDSFCFHLTTSHREFGEEPASGKICSHFGEHYTLFERALAMANVKLVRMACKERDYLTPANSSVISSTVPANPFIEDPVAMALSDATNNNPDPTLIKTDGSPSVSSQKSTISLSSTGSSSDSDVELTILPPAQKPPPRPSAKRPIRPRETRAMTLAARVPSGDDINSNSEDED